LGEGLLQPCGRDTACDRRTFRNESKASCVHHKRQSRYVSLEKDLEVGGKARATERNGVPCHVNVMSFKAIGADERERNLRQILRLALG